MSELKLPGKGILRSKTVWGAIIAGLPALDLILVTAGVLPAPVVADGADAIISAAGALLAVWGRLKATATIDRLF